LVLGGGLSRVGKESRKTTQRRVGQKHKRQRILPYNRGGETKQNEKWNLFARDGRRRGKTTLTWNTLREKRKRSRPKHKKNEKREGSV